MDKFIKLLDLLRKDKPLAVHICYMGGATNVEYMCIRGRLLWICSKGRRKRKC